MASADLSEILEPYRDISMPLAVVSDEGKVFLINKGLSAFGDFKNIQNIHEIIPNLAEVSLQSLDISDPFKLQSTNGDFFTVEIRVDTQEVAAETYYFLWIIDVSEKQDLEQSLKETENKMDGYVEELTAAIEANIKNKELVDAKNDELLSSLRYASSIQNVFHSGETNQKEFFPQSFQIYKPQNIVSGDIVWIAETHIGKAVASIDCMGHGVPGALLSISVIQCLEVVNAQGYFYSATDFLAQVVDLYIRSFKKEITDTFDISLCIFNADTQLTFFQSIKRPIILQHEGKNEYITGTPFDIKEFNALAKKKELPQDIVRPLRKGDRYYLFSDGYVDQFGGPKNKKFKLKPFMELLETTAIYDIELQGKMVEQAFEDWKNFDPALTEQIDDVSVIGIEIINLSKFA